MTRQNFKKILLCFGTRPEAIKMCSLYHYLKDYFNVKVCVTGQHKEMLEQVLDFFEVKPDYDLKLMRENQSLNILSGNLFIEFDKVLSEAEPDLVLVHGDTTTSAICSLSAFNRKIKVGHIEAGLRTYDKHSPFPEEINRQINSRVCDFHFAPTRETEQNLLSEKINQKSITVTGNTVIDSLLWTVNKLNNGFFNEKIKELLEIIDSEKKIILVTCHRRENFGERLVDICNAIKKIAQETDSVIIFPVHPNPNIKKNVLNLLDGIKDIHLIDPLDYPSFIWLMTKSYLILTDSGGIQEEAPSLGKPVLVLRDTTERPEALKVGCVKLVGHQTEDIYNEVKKILDNENEYLKMTQIQNPYGDGLANKRVCNFILENL